MAYYILKSYKLKTDPLKIFAILSQQKHCFFLDSSLNGGLRGRYSFLGSEPFLILKSKGLDPFKKIRQTLEEYKISGLKNNFPFFGGAVGYLAYDLGLVLEEKIKIRPKEETEIPDCFFGFYNTVVIIDHLKGLLYILAIGFPEKSSRLAKSLATANFKKISQLLIKANMPLNNKESINPRGKARNLEANFSKEDYILAIQKAKEYIRRGDIYQVNLTQRFQAQTNLSSLEIYKRLRKISPSYFSAYLDAGGHQVISSSPERFLQLENNIVTTQPMKGTRPRSDNKRQDTQLKMNLLASAKDKAELMMIVDLERNDLGRVCSYDSIKVNRLRELEKYTTVFQTTATVSGRLHKNKDRLDLLRACFPGGSITGCPKIRAMEIIEELEPDRRSIYTGSFGYLSFNGGMDFSILIRTILKKDHQLYFGVGGGIVTDSIPEDEYNETLVKAKAMIEAING